MTENRSIWYSEEYKTETFYLWYNGGRPSPAKLQMMIPEDWEGDIPSVSTLKTWIKHNFTPQADKINEQIAKEMEARMVKEKVEMLSRHAELGGKMQDIGLSYIEDNEDKLTSSTAVRMLVAGVQIERDSRGLPQAIEQMIDKSDEDLLEVVMQLVGESQVEILED